MPQVEGFPHDAAAVDGDTPATGAWNLGDQAMSAEAAKDTADFGASLFGVLGALPQMRRRGQPVTDIPVAETAEIFSNCFQPKATALPTHL